MKRYILFSGRTTKKTSFNATDDSGTLKRTIDFSMHAGDYDSIEDVRTMLAKRTVSLPKHYNLGDYKLIDTQTGRTVLEIVDGVAVVGSL